MQYNAELGLLSILLPGHHPELSPSHATGLRLWFVLLHAHISMHQVPNPVNPGMGCAFSVGRIVPLQSSARFRLLDTIRMLSLAAAVEALDFAQLFPAI